MTNTKKSIQLFFFFWFSIILISCGGKKEEGQFPNPYGGPAYNKSTSERLDANGKGHGGDAVVCFDNLEMRNKVKTALLNNVGSIHPTNPFEEESAKNAVKKVQIFDLYEYQLPTGFPPKSKDLISFNGTFLEELPKVIARASVKTELGEKLSETLKYLPLDNWKESDGVVEIDDSENAVILPSLCLLVQIAVRQENVVFYDRQLFSKLDELNRLALVMHELTYKVATDLNQSDSRQARAASSLLLSKSEFDGLSPFALNQKLLRLSDYAFPLIAGGQTIWAKRVQEIFNDGSPKSFSLKVDFTHVRVNNWDLAVDSTSKKYSVRLDENHEIHEVYGHIITEGVHTISRNPAQILIGEKRLSCIYPQIDGRLEYHDKVFLNVNTLEFTDHELTSMMALEYKNTLENAYGKFNFMGEVKFYPGTLKPRSVATATVVQMKYGYMDLSGVEFYENGQVKSAQMATTRKSPVSECNFEHKPCYYSNANGLAIHISKAEIQFYENGDIATLKTGIPLQNYPEIDWKLGTFRGVVSIEFFPGERPKKITFGNKGSVYHKIQAPIEKQVGPITIELDEDGKIITPF